MPQKPLDGSTPPVETVMQPVVPLIEDWPLPFTKKRVAKPGVAVLCWVLVVIVVILILPVVLGFYIVKLVIRQSSAATTLGNKIALVFLVALFVIPGNIFWIRGLTGGGSSKTSTQEATPRPTTALVVTPNGQPTVAPTPAETPLDFSVLNTFSIPNGGHHYWVLISPALGNKHDLRRLCDKVNGGYASERNTLFDAYTDARAYEIQNSGSSLTNDDDDNFLTQHWVLNYIKNANTGLRQCIITPYGENQQDINY